MRIFRGLTKKYRPEEVGKGKEGPFIGTDFTDCSYSALQLARGSRGEVLVLDILADAMEFLNSKRFRVTEALWFTGDSGPRRYIVWGRFDDFLVAEIPAKKLPAQVR
ncbi:MAG: hypothetical protein HY717_08770 [Planctomycetes bacterium]|nr:hypothetical protein [Planctomycetota bacterium]